jgi:hypothetical protein
MTRHSAITEKALVCPRGWCTRRAWRTERLPSLPHSWRCTALIPHVQGRDVVGTDATAGSNVGHAG